MDLQPPKPPHHRPPRPTNCHRHPGQNPTGLCAPCLRERLSLLNPSASTTSSSSSSSSHHNSTAVPAANRLNAGVSSSSAIPELRRCKTFSGNKCESIASGYEPRRKSCDVRVRSSLWDLFNMEDEARADLVCAVGDHRVDSKNSGLVAGKFPALEDNGDEIRPAGGEIGVLDGRIVWGNRGFGESRRIKEFIDLHTKKSGGKPARRDFKEIAGSFWISASVFSRKLLRRSRRSRKRAGDGDVPAAGGNLGGIRADHRVRGRQLLRDTQSEAGDYGFGRRSCDTDPRCSVDLGRASVDDRMWLDLLGRRSCDTDSKISIDLGRASVDGGRASAIEAPPPSSLEPPRASWDGSRVTSRTVPPGTVPAVSVIENAMAAVYGLDNGALINEKLNMGNGDCHGHRFGRASLQRRREGKEFDNLCKTATRRDETRVTYKDKVSPESMEFHQGERLLISEQEIRDLAGFSSLEDDSLASSSESASKDVSSFSSSKSGKQPKKSRPWWSIWGILQPRTRGHCEQGSKSKRGGEDCRYADSSWKVPKLARSDISKTTPGPAQRMSSSSSRAQTTDRSRQRREGSASESHWFGRYSPNGRSSGYSPSSLDNGLSRFNLTPLKTYRANGHPEKGRARPPPWQVLY